MGSSSSNRGTSYMKPERGAIQYVQHNIYSPLDQHEPQSHSSSPTATPSADILNLSSIPGQSRALNLAARRRIRVARQIPIRAISLLIRVARQIPIRAMSLVGLKHIFLQTVTPGLFKLNCREQCGNDRPSSIGTVNSADLESQSANSKSEVAENKRFRVNARIISDATIGLSDGLTVPFALTAGLSALGSTKIVIYGGFAELLAGAISMGLGGWLGAKSELASYKAMREDTQRVIDNSPRTVMAEITEVFKPYNLPKSTLDDLSSHLIGSPKLIDFVMQFKHCAEAPASSRALTSATTIALGYFLGGLLPLIPYFCVDQYQVYTGLYISIGIMVFALFVFGYVKTCVVIGWHGGRNIRAGCSGGVQMVVVGSVAAAAAMGLVRAFNQGGGA